MNEVSQTECAGETGGNPKLSFGIGSDYVSDSRLRLPGQEPPDPVVYKTLCPHNSTATKQLL